ncbi:unnamed protein product [Linum tenue]|uniref:DUF4283 domain-containing protein n=1 Tax=Linum tenue TaxID=586396 RepID=A0AAV0QZF3_9ROSI|nr:unnamed protein product [Linum tenue]
MVWVQLPGLPVEFYNREAVLIIAQSIGNPIRVDRATELGARTKFARVCVEVDLTQPLLAKYSIEGKKFLIRYEGLENICDQCGSYGKPPAQCPCQNPTPVSPTGEVEMVEETQLENDPSKGKAYGDWMTVKRKDRRPQGRGGQRGNHGEASKNYIQKGNRFATLGEEAHVVHDHAHVEQIIEGKEGTCGRVGDTGIKTTKQSGSETNKQNEGNKKSHGMNDNSGKKSSLTTGGVDRPHPKGRTRDNTTVEEGEGNRLTKDTGQGSGGTSTMAATHIPTSSGAQIDKNTSMKATTVMQGVNKNGAGNRSPSGNK